MLIGRISPKPIVDPSSGPRVSVNAQIVIVA